MRRVLALIAIAALAACQDYNFNPVGKCVIQPGSSRIQLSSVGAADILFVVDDSGSMSAEQANLARNFGAFIDALATAQKERAQNSLDPFEFHVAVTSSSIFEAWQPSQATTCTGSPLECTIRFSHYSSQQTTNTCVDHDAGCEDLIRDYWFQTTDPGARLTYCASANAGVGTPGARYPSGDFVRSGANPRVLHFLKTLDWTSWISPWTAVTSYAAGKLATNGGNTYQCITAGASATSGGPTGTAADITDGTAHWKYVSASAVDLNLTALVQQFQDNIHVGTCGSGMEQHIEAAKLAMKKALRQDGLVQPVPQSEFGHAKAKLVIVWVGDEDDCSNPNDPTRSLAFTDATSGPGSDVCTGEESKPLDQQKLFRIAEYADFFTSLGQPLGAAFVYSAKVGTCRDDGNGNVVCTPGTCSCITDGCPASCDVCGPSAQGICQIPSDCSGKIPLTASRLSQLSAALRQKGVNTFEASVCDSNWSATLQGIAQLVKPPPGLQLPTQPADKDVAVLRIENADGNASRYCAGPANGADWWFVDCTTGQFKDGATSCITINHDTGHCEANTGETYVAQYLGRVPDSGCFSDDECNQALHNTTASFRCVGQVGTRAGGGTPGTCLCQ